MAKIRVRFPTLVLLLGIVFLIAVSISIAYREKNVIKNHERPQEREQEGRDPRQQPHPHHQEEQEREHTSEEERDREPSRGNIGKRESKSKRKSKVLTQTHPDSHRQRNPYYFNFERFRTLYRNRKGQIRVLERGYRIVEFQPKPNTLILPKHFDVDYILIVLNAMITIVISGKRQAYNLEYGDALKLPVGTTSYILNSDDNQNLRVVKLVIPINNLNNFYVMFFLLSYYLLFLYHLIFYAPIAYLTPSNFNFFLLSLHICHPISINASSNLHLLGFRINGDENQRNFLVGSEDNVIRQLEREVKELTFPGSTEDVERSDGAHIPLLCKCSASTTTTKGERGKVWKKGSHLFHLEHSLLSCYVLSWLPLRYHLRSVPSTDVSYSFQPIPCSVDAIAL
ncbi:hypothetical protein TanjilG_21205 [Lupinus angustifolius]|uniref:Cupin type-1 domain-containing protein n=1 Tax=Lupinus angustifolius TaxID=3871 RepID=A0A4P1R8K0_LUPAN|nr:hypothetical protein TanjilG_21205 [Lupinus angustifolius]